MFAAIRRAFETACTLLNKIEWIGPLAVRIAVGLAFAINGWAKLHNLGSVTELFESLGIPAAGAQAAMVSTIEFAGGLAILLGLGTRIAAALLVGVMTVATLTSQLPQVDHVWDLAGTIEVTYLVIFVWLVIHGAGAVSLDRLIGRAKHDAAVGTTP
jgi:putative oxidoreductase